ncbi:serine hydrolase [Paenibacillus flagellatus]|nr:serine hydrolase [Paenibacillus flagellatus]
MKRSTFPIRCRWLVIAAAALLGAEAATIRISNRAYAAADPYAAVTAHPTSRTVDLKLNSHPARFERPAIEIDGVVFAPFRDLFELFQGAEVSWDPDKQAASVRIPALQSEIVVAIGSRTARLNGRELGLEADVRLIEGKTMIPLQRLSEAMGARLERDPTGSAVHLVRKGLANLLKTEARTGRTGEFPSPSSWPSAADWDLQRKIDWVDRFLADNRFNGSVLVASGEKALLNKGYGLADDGAPNGPQTKFRLMSVSKSFTAAAILKLEEQGRLSLQDPIGAYAEGLPFGDRVTLHHLLSHTSGLAREYDRSPDYTLERLVADLRDDSLAFEPGTGYRYSNAGYALLAYVIERVSGVSYGDFLRTSLFEPLGMTGSGQYLASSPPERMARGYWDDGEKLRPDAPHFSLPGGGDLYSTTEDLWRWERALTAGEALSSDSYAKMTKPNSKSYGYGLHIGRDGSLYHEGSGSGFSAFYYRHPERDRTIVLLSNVSDVKIDDVGLSIAKWLP